MIRQTRWMSPPPENDIAVRNGIRAKHLSIWGATFEDLYAVLNAAEGIEGLVALGTANEMMSRDLGHLGFECLPYSLQFVVTEAIDDWWAAYLCFLNGFTKQAQQLLRNTVELIVQFYYLREVQGSTPTPNDRWIKGTRGIEHVREKIDGARGALEAVIPGTASRVSNLYDMLCMSVHSHKDRMTTFRMPRTMLAGDMPSIEPSEILYTRAVFVMVWDLNIRLLRAAFSDWEDYHWRYQIDHRLSEMLSHLSKYRRVVENFERGYLIWREHALLTDGTQILYSMKLDGRWELPGRKRRMTSEQVRELRNLLDERLIQDKP